MPFPPKAAERIAANLDAGLLPTRIHGKLYAGFGSGHLCAGCATPVLRAQVEYEFEDAEGRTFRFHLGCEGLWEAALLRRGLKPRDEDEPTIRTSAAPDDTGRQALFEQAIAAMIRAKVMAGALPSRTGALHASRFGQGNPCDGCERPIDPGQVEYRFEWPESGSIRLHVGCAAIWQVERLHVRPLPSRDEEPPDPAA